MNKCIVVSCMLALGVNSVYAGDMGKPSYDFDGAYLGLGSGVMTLFTQENRENVRGNDIKNFTDTAVLFTGDIGYGRMFKEDLYLGVKGSIYYTALNHLNEGTVASSGGSRLVVGDNEVTTSLQPIYNIDAVLGYEVLPHLLPFVEAGVSFSTVNTRYRLKRTETLVSTPTSTVQYESIFTIGGNQTSYNVGLGINYQPHKNLFFSTELMYNDLGQRRGTTTMTVPPVAGTGARIDSDTRAVTSQDVALFGSVSYLFGG